MNTTQRLSKERLYEKMRKIDEKWINASGQKDSGTLVKDRERISRQIKELSSY